VSAGNPVQPCSTASSLARSVWCERVKCCSAEPVDPATLPDAAFFRWAAKAFLKVVGT